MVLGFGYSIPRVNRGDVDVEVTHVCVGWTGIANGGEIGYHLLNTATVGRLPLAED